MLCYDKVDQNKPQITKGWVYYIMNTTDKTDIYQTKRALVQFTEKLAVGLSQPDRKFLLDMIYGLIKSRSPILTEIARALEENTRLLYTVKRLSNRAAAFSDFSRLEQNYFNAIQPQLRDDMYVIVDNSDITKPFGQQFEYLQQVYDGSLGGTGKGYMSAHMAIASTKTKPPFPFTLIYFPRLKNTLTVPMSKPTKGSIKCKDSS